MVTFTEEILDGVDWIKRYTFISNKVNKKIPDLTEAKEHYKLLLKNKDRNTVKYPENGNKKTDIFR